MQLRTIVNISTGVYQKSSSNGDLLYLQVRDFNKYHSIKNNVEPNIVFEEKLRKHLLTKGNILFAAKGYDRFAHVYKNETIQAVASSSFLVIRIFDENIVIPEFIAWYLNHPKTQNIFDRIAKGTNLPSVSKVMVEEIEINIPSIEKQKQILKIDELRIKERLLNEKITLLKSQLINQKLINILK